MRRLWITVHKWIGLGIGMLFVLQGLTGSWNVFYRELDGVLNPGLWQADNGPTWRPLDELAAAAAAHCDAGLAGPLRVELPSETGRAVGFSCDVDGADTLVTVAPKTAAVLGVRADADGFSNTVYHLHAELLLGETGTRVLTVMAASLLVSCLTGIYLWWPRPGTWRRAFRMRRSASGAAWWLELHRVAGVYVVVTLTVAALTGLWLVLPPSLIPVRTLDIRSLPAYETPAIEWTPGAARIGWQAALEAGRAHFPAAHVDELQFPGDAAEPVLVVARQPGEWREVGGDSVLWLHPQTGEAVGRFDSSLDASVADRVILALFPLHNGQAYGLVHRWLVFFTGLVPALLFVSGFVVWQRRRPGAAARVPGRRFEHSEKGDGHLY